MNPILFLDFDGVLNPDIYSNHLAKIWKYSGELCKSRDQFGDYFAPWCVDELKATVNITGCDIVVISTWRAFCDVKHLWESRRLPGKCIGATWLGVDDKGPEITRGLEVKAWCERNGTPEKYAILDDIDEFTNIFGGDHYVRPRALYGWTRKETEKLFNLLL